MKVAITDHAVTRYVERVQGAKDLSTDSVRMVIQELIDEAFATGNVRNHPSEGGRKIVPFKSGNANLYLSLGPNETRFPGDFAVIGVVFDRELGGVGGMGVKLGELAPALKAIQPKVQTLSDDTAKFIVRIGTESYDVKDDADLKDLLHRRQPRPDQVTVYQRKPMKIRTEYVIEEE